MPCSNGFQNNKNNTSRLLGRANRRLARFETLEDRRMLAVLTVNTNMDNTTTDSMLSLREAVLLVNNGGDAIAALGRALTVAEESQLDSDGEAFGTNDTINFNIGGVGVQVIQPTSPLPAISSRLYIDGHSQTDFGGDANPFGPEIVLDGSLAGGDANGLHLDSDGNRVHALAIQLFSKNGILVTGDENELAGNYIGTNATGDAPAANGGDGVQVISSSGNLIGGAAAAARNIISGNIGHGIEIGGVSATENFVLGNVIGLNAAGNATLGNQRDGIAIAARAM